MEPRTVEWNVADLLEEIADVRHDAPMIIEDHRILSWDDVDQRSNRLARHLLDAGLVRGDRVAVCTRNVPACLEAYIACCKVSLVPFNVNFRYGADEIAYLLDNADARAAVVQEEFVESFADAAQRAGTIETMIVVADTSTTDPSRSTWTDYEHVVTAGSGERVATTWGRSPDDLLFQYTGGTTGMPKAVMWRQGDLVTLLAGKDAPPDEDRSGATADIADRLAVEPRRSCTIAPLIHGTGLLSQLANFFTGGTSVMLGGRGFDPAQAWACVERHRVNVLVIVGDPMARPLLEQLERDERLERDGASYDLNSLKMITSSGAMFSRPVKAGLLGLLPNLVLLDAFGSSEASGLGVSMSTADDLDATAVFRIGPQAKLLTDDGAMVEPMSGVVGRIAMSGCVPVGYHKDPIKSAETYPTVDGVRYSVPGDYVTVDDEGNLTLLGRGSAVINTGGEKVHPEEIEEILKEHTSVVDAACIGVPDPRFGAAVCAVVQLSAEAAADADEVATVAATVDALREHVRGRAAGFKVPRHIMIVDDLGRHPNGKLDRTAVTERALAAINASEAISAASRR
ncbi:MAG: AMP-binding protein [Ilumatobacteraceae bacterium]